MNTNFKYLQKLFFLLLMGFSLCAVQACSDEEEDEPIQEPNGEEVVKPDNGKEEDEPSNKPTIGTIDGHEYVDLGLSVKWATCNVGASKPEDYGGYYAWGETEEKSDYSDETYKWSKGTYDTVTKYCTDGKFGTVDYLIRLTSSDDVATVKWGSKWRTPTKKEMKELCEDCTWKWTTQSGVKGMKVTGPNGKSLFLPAGTSYFGTNCGSLIPYGFYWSASLGEGEDYTAYTLYFDSGYSKWEYQQGRCDGLSVRPVTE